MRGFFDAMDAGAYDAYLCIVPGLMLLCLWLWQRKLDWEAGRRAIAEELRQRAHLSYGSAMSKAGHTVRTWGPGSPEAQHALAEAVRAWQTVRETDPDVIPDLESRDVNEAMRLLEPVNGHLQ